MCSRFQPLLRKANRLLPSLAQAKRGRGNSKTSFFLSIKGSSELFGRGFSALPRYLAVADFAIQ